MNDFLSTSSYFGIFLTVLAYLLAIGIRKRLRSGLANPLLIAAVLTIGTLLLCRIDYETYNSSAGFLTMLLTPATVCLAIPLYQQIDKLKKNFAAIFTGILSGSLAGMTSVYLLSRLLGFSKEEYITFLPKSITTAIGMGVSQELGGIVPITVASIILTGILGHIICEAVLKAAGVRRRIAKGAAIGTASHAIGTSKAIEIGEIEGAISSLSIVIAGIITVLFSGFFAGLY